MLEVEGLDAFKFVLQRPDRDNRFPLASDSRFRHGGLYPSLCPRFNLAKGETVFTIGSCFARNIENVLVEHGFNVPVSRFQLPPGELKYPAPHLLNEYNAGTIFQRLGQTLGLYEYDPDAGIEETSEGCIDLFLHVESNPISRQRLHERRNEIAGLYKQMLSSGMIVITLGLVEAWYDNKYDCYVNKPPSYRFVRENAGRFSFRRFDPPDIIEYLEKSMVALNNAGIQKILLTVSPIPLEVSFLPGDIINNNCYSKCSLRVGIEAMFRKYPFVDYYPSYEIVNTYGLVNGYDGDHIHVKVEVVSQVIAHMVNHYIEMPQQDRLKTA